MNIRLVVLAVAGLAMAGCDDAGESWWGVVYPDRSDLMHYEDIGYFPNVEACRARAVQRLSILEASTGLVGDYECGLNCREGPGTGNNVRICQETLR